MSLGSKESRDYAKALLSGMIVPTLLIALFLVSARATLSPAAAPVKAVPAPTVTYLAGSSYGSSEDREFFWALVDGRDEDKRHTIGSTDGRAQRLISRALRRDGGKFLYLRVDGRDYIVRDAGTVSSASEMVKPMEELGKKMGELGGRQGVLGGRQGELGGAQGMLGARQAELAARQVKLSLRIHSRERDGLSTAALEREKRDIDEEMRECSEKQTELGRRQTELGAQQTKLGAIQSRYGAEMSRVSADVEKRMRRLAQESIQSGQAVELTDDDA